MLTHMGVSDALFGSAVLMHDKLNGEIFNTSKTYQILIRSDTFTDRRLYGALGVDGVETATGVYFGLAPWTNPWTGGSRDIFILAFKPRAGVLNLKGIEEHLVTLREPATALFDALARPEFGPAAEAFQADGPFDVQVGNRKLRVAGLFEAGTSFGIDGSLIMSDLNFLRLPTGAREGLVSVGVVKLKPDADVAAVRSELERVLPGDVHVLSREEFKRNEIDYWANSTPIGFTTMLGVVMGWIVGAVIVYQILCTLPGNQAADRWVHSCA
jgi:putative ABC transport system permease protein